MPKRCAHRRALGCPEQSVRPSNLHRHADRDEPNRLPSALHRIPTPEQTNCKGPPAPCRQERAYQLADVRPDTPTPSVYPAPDRPSSPDYTYGNGSTWFRRGLPVGPYSTARVRQPARPDSIAISPGPFFPLYRWPSRLASGRLHHLQRAPLATCPLHRAAGKTSRAIFRHGLRERATTLRRHGLSHDDIAHSLSLKPHQHRPRANSPKPAVFLAENAGPHSAKVLQNASRSD